MKKCFCVVLVLLLFLSSCNTKPPSYPFPSKQVEILSVELIHNQNPDGFGIDEDKFFLLKELDAEDIPLFMNDIYELQTEWSTPPGRGYGSYIARVTYANGDIEMLCSRHIEFIASGSEKTGVGSYYFVEDGFVSVFWEYTDISDLLTEE